MGFYHSEPIKFKKKKKEEEVVKKKKINDEDRMEIQNIGNRSSISVFEERQKILAKEPAEIIIYPEDRMDSNSNPFDVPLLDQKDAILYKGPLHRYNFEEYEPFNARFVVVTRNALRIYENEKQSLNSYSRPICAIPLSAISHVSRTQFPKGDDDRLTQEGYQKKASNMFELFLKDEFLLSSQTDSQSLVSP